MQLAAPPDCEAAARAFYGELLGLRELEKPAVLRGRGGVWFALEGGGALHVGVVPEGFVPAEKAHPALRASGPAALGELARRIEQAGHPVSFSEPLRGVTARCFTADPWGNRLELLA